MSGMRAALSRAPHPALFLTTWSVSTFLGCGVALVALAALPPTVAELTSTGMIAPLVTMAILVIITELRPIMMSRFEGDPISISQAFVFAALYLWGPAPAIALMAVSTLISEALARKEAWKLIFNVGNYTLAVVAAAAVLAPGAWPEADGSVIGAGDLGLVALSWVAYHLVNLAQVAGLAEEQTWWQSFTEDFWFYTVSAVAVLALSPLVAVVAIHGDFSWVLLPLLLPPLLAVQRTAQMSQEREHLAQEREHRALHDPLTGLPNRTLLT